MPSRLYPICDQCEAEIERKEKKKDFLLCLELIVREKINCLEPLVPVVPTLITPVCAMQQIKQPIFTFILQQHWFQYKSSGKSRVNSIIVNIIVNLRYVAFLSFKSRKPEL